MRKYIIYSVMCLLVSAILLAPKVLPDYGCYAVTANIGAIHISDFPLIREVSNKSLWDLYNTIKSASTYDIHLIKYLATAEDEATVLDRRIMYSVKESKGRIITDSSDYSMEVYFGEDYLYKLNNGEWSYATTDEGLALCQQEANCYSKSRATIDYVFENLLNDMSLNCTVLNEYTSYSVTLEQPVVNDELVISDLTSDSQIVNLQVRVPSDNLINRVYCCITIFYNNSDLDILREYYEYEVQWNYRVALTPNFEVEEQL